MKYILGGHWTETPEGWEAKTEEQVDITKPLPWANGSVDAIFTEHVIEHVFLTEGIMFLREAFRVLKPGGILRTVAPFADQLVKFEQRPYFVGKPDAYQHDLRRDYINTSLTPYYRQEAAELERLYLRIHDYGLPFFLDSLLKKHNHKFVWSTDLLAEVLKGIGLTDVVICLPGESTMDQSTCLERRVRGITNSEGISFYDCESLAVEARK